MPPDPISCGHGMSWHTKHGCLELPFSLGLWLRQFSLEEVVGVVRAVSDRIGVTDLAPGRERAVA